DTGKEIVLGYSPYKKEGGLLNLIIRYDTFYTAKNYLSFALAGNPYMGVGRNLSYRKGLFFRNKGFASILGLPSGDDDLFVNKFATPSNTAVQICKESFVISNPKDTWGAWMHQKRRHHASGKYYKGNHKMQLGSIWFSTVFFYAALIACLWFPVLWIPVAVAWFLRFVIRNIIVYKSLTRLNDSGFWIYTLVLDFVYQIILLPAISLGSSMAKKKKTRW
nr:transmembrane glycosyltransferase [Bacteroidota bacterium]